MRRQRREGGMDGWMNSWVNIARMEIGIKGGGSKQARR